MDEAGKQLVKVTHDCWQAAIDYCRPGADYAGIGRIVEDFIRPYGYTSVRAFCGHGIGKAFHMAPNVVHHANSEPGTRMEVGHCFTIEPMICEGTEKHVEWEDGWTATTQVRTLPRLIRCWVRGAGWSRGCDSDQRLGSGDALSKPARACATHESGDRRRRMASAPRNSSTRCSSRQMGPSRSPGDCPAQTLSFGTSDRVTRPRVNARVVHRYRSLFTTGVQYT